MLLILGTITYLLFGFSQEVTHNAAMRLWSTVKNDALVQELPFVPSSVLAKDPEKTTTPSLAEKSTHAPTAPKTAVTTTTTAAPHVTSSGHTTPSHTEKPKTEAPKNQTPRISIPAVGITAPIFWNVDGQDMDEYLSVLEKGIAHYKGTPLPGQSGSSLLFGHSSYNYDMPNNMDSIFAPLHNVKNGDRVYIEKEDGTTLTFEVYQTKVIVPTDLEFLSQAGPTRVTLMTCTPIGTTKNRLLVYAKQIQP